MPFPHAFWYWKPIKPVIPRIASRKLSLKLYSATEAVSQMASRKLSRSTTVFRPLSARLLTPSPSSMRFLKSCARPTRIATSLTLCHARRSTETVTRLSLCRAILLYTKIAKIFFRSHSHKTSNRLNKSRIITVKPPEL